MKIVYTDNKWIKGKIKKQNIDKKGANKTNERKVKKTI